MTCCTAAPTTCARPPDRGRGGGPPAPPGPAPQGRGRRGRQRGARHRGRPDRGRARAPVPGARRPWCDRRVAARDQADCRPARALPPQFRRGQAAARPGPLCGDEHSGGRSEGHLRDRQPYREHVVLPGGHRRQPVRQGLHAALLADLRAVRGHADRPCRLARRPHRPVGRAAQASPQPAAGEGARTAPDPGAPAGHGDS